MKDKPFVYLACPYSHPDTKVRLERFLGANMAAGALMKAGAYVFSPLSHSHPIAIATGLPTTWAYWEGYNRAMLACCRKLVVLMMDGWKESKGVQSEIRIAEEMMMPIEYMTPLT